MGVFFLSVQPYELNTARISAWLFSREMVRISDKNPCFIEVLVIHILTWFNHVFKKNKLANKYENISTVLVVFFCVTFQLHQLILNILLAQEPCHVLQHDLHFHWLQHEMLQRLRKVLTRSCSLLTLQGSWVRAAGSEGEGPQGGAVSLLFVVWYTLN